MTTHYVKAVPDSWLFLPGIGRVRDGRAYYGAHLERFVPRFLARVENPGAVVGSKPEPEPEPAEASESKVEAVYIGKSLIEDYDEMNVGEAVDAILALDTFEEVQAQLSYEREHKNRKGVLSEIEDWLGEWLDE